MIGKLGDRNSKIGRVLVLLLVLVIAVGYASMKRSKETKEE